MSPVPAGRVAGLKRSLIREIFESAPADALNLGLGQPDLDPPAVFREALARATQEGPAGYGPTAGDRRLREMIAQYYAPFVTGPEHVVVTVGCQEATFLAIGALCDPGDEVLLPDPGFPGSRTATAVWGGTPRLYPLHAERDFHLDPDEVLAMIGPRTKALFVITPSNPTGTIEPLATLERLYAETAARGIALIIDDTYHRLSWLDENGAPGAPKQAMEHVVVCGGLSKSVALTGWRVGWAVSPDTAFMARLVALQQNVLTCAATPIQIAARTAFTPEGEAAAREVRGRFLARRNMVHELLGSKPGVRIAPLEGAFYAWADVSRVGGGRAFAKRLLEEDRIVTIPGEAFGSATDWLRISYAQEDGALAKALVVIADRLRA